MITSAFIAAPWLFQPRTCRFPGELSRSGKRRFAFFGAEDGGALCLVIGCTDQGGAKRLDFRYGLFDQPDVQHVLQPLGHVEKSLAQTARNLQRQPESSP